MKVQDVPQDDDIDRGVEEITYAVDENGRYVRVRSLGWGPKNIANDQAWEAIDRDLQRVVSAVRTGKQSPLAYHMAKHLMNERLLASYVGLPCWRVKRHLKPSVYKRLGPDILKRYAAVFGVPTEALNAVPDAPMRETSSP